MQDFQNQVSRTSSKIKYLQDTTLKFEEEIKKKASSVLDSDEEDLLHREIKEIEHIFREKADDVKAELKDIKTTNDKIKAQGYDSTSTFQFETRNSHWQALTNSFSDACKNFRNAQVKYRKLEEQKLISQYKIVYPGMSVDQIKEKIQKCDGEDLDAFGGTGKGLSGAQDAYSRAKERRKRVIEIIESISQLCLLIDELHEMVKQSGRTIDRIEVKITMSEEKTAKAKRELQKGLGYQLSRTKMKRILYGVVALFLIIFVIYLIVKIIRAFKEN